MPTDPGDWPALVLYRHAYGIAVRLAEARRYSLGFGPESVSEAAGGDTPAIVAEVLRWIDDDRPDVAAIVREAVEDALARRRPKW